MKINTRNAIIGDIAVPALDELGFGETTPEIISTSGHEEGYGADIVLRLHTETPNVSWLCYIEKDFLNFAFQPTKLTMYCVLTEERGITFKVLDKTAYNIYAKDMKFEKAEEIDSEIVSKLFKMK